MISLKYNKYGDRTWQYSSESSVLPLSWWSPWFFRIWKGGNVVWWSKTTLGIGVLGVQFIVSFPFKF